jgi:hypothetical protein
VPVSQLKDPQVRPPMMDIQDSLPHLSTEYQSNCREKLHKTCNINKTFTVPAKKKKQI